MYPLDKVWYTKRSKLRKEVMLWQSPKGRAFLNAQRKLKRNLVSIKRGDIWFHTFVYGDRRIILNKEEKLKVDEKRNT